MSWNETFYWLAILSLSLVIAQFGVPSISSTFYKRIFGHEPSSQVREVMRVFPNFLALLTIIALFVAFAAGLELIVGLGSNLALVVAEHFSYSGNTALMMLTLAVSCGIMVWLAFITLRFVWRSAARLPSRNLGTQQDTGAINAEIQQHLKEIKEGNAKTKGKRHNKK
jgi:hypothetical protein